MAGEGGETPTCWNNGSKTSGPKLGSSSLTPPTRVCNLLGACLFSVLPWGGEFSHSPKKTSLTFQSSEEVYLQQIIFVTLFDWGGGLCKSGPRSLWWWYLKFLRVKHLVDFLWISSCRSSPWIIVLNLSLKSHHVLHIEAHNKQRHLWPSAHSGGNLAYRGGDVLGVFSQHHTKTGISKWQFAALCFLNSQDMSRKPKGLLNKAPTTSKYSCHEIPLSVARQPTWKKNGRKCL